MNTRYHTLGSSGKKRWNSGSPQRKCFTLQHVLRNRLQRKRAPVTSRRPSQRRIYKENQCRLFGQQFGGLRTEFTFSSQMANPHKAAKRRHNLAPGVGPGTHVVLRSSPIGAKDSVPVSRLRRFVSKHEKTPG